MGVGLSWLIGRSKKETIPWLNGLSIFGGILFIDAITLMFYYGNIEEIGLTVKGLFAQMGHFTGIAMGLFVIYLTVRGLGSVLTTIFPPRINPKDLPLIQVALGIVGLTFLLFILAALGLLYSFTVLPLVALIWVISGKEILRSAKSILLTPIQRPKNLNLIGVLSILFLITFLVFNFTQILRPFPLGTDAIRVYVNLPSLLADYNGLVAGFQPYNWSLFMSLGSVVFGRIDMVLALSFFGGVMSLHALFLLGRKWLNFNYTALCLFLFYSVPLINHLSYMDMKIDMGLLFFTLATILLFYNWLKPYVAVKEAKMASKPIAKKVSKKTTKKPVKGKEKKTSNYTAKINAYFSKLLPSTLKDNRLLVLMGLFSGFAFGIKLTAIITLFALLCAIWFNKGGKLGYLTAFLLVFAGIFILQLDAQPLLRQFHQGVNVLQWILLACGLSSLVYMYLKQKEKTVQLIRYSAILCLFFALPVLPWLGKNFIETQSISVNGLLNGKESTPIFELTGATSDDVPEDVVIRGLYNIPALPEKTKSDGPKVVQSVREDLHKIMGYEIILSRYLSLPYDTSLKTNFDSASIDIGILLLLLFPLIFLFSRNKG